MDAPFTMVSNAVMEHGQLGPGPRMVYVALLMYARGTKRCWPSLSLLAANTGTCERTVRGYLDELVKAAWITRESRHGRSTLYILHDPPTPEKSTHLPRQNLPTHPPTPAKFAYPPRQNLPPKNIQVKYTQLSPNGESGTYSLFGEDVDDGYDASGRKRATKLPPGFQLTARRRDEAYRLGVTDPELEWGAFVDFHTARGSTYLSWPAAWRMWCRNTHRFGQQQRARPSGRTAEQEWAELMRRERESSQSQRDDQ